MAPLTPIANQLHITPTQLPSQHGEKIDLELGRERKERRKEGSVQSGRGLGQLGLSGQSVLSQASCSSCSSSGLLLFSLSHFLPDVTAAPVDVCVSTQARVKSGFSSNLPLLYYPHVAYVMYAGTLAPPA